MPDHALDGITVLDFTHILQGPFATQKLADMGARVVKVERPDVGERYRPFEVHGELLGGESPFFHGLNRNKDSIEVDLKSEEGHDICMQLGERSDVVVSNYRPSVMERLGLGYEDFEAVNDSIIYCQATGYGDSGPYEDLPGQDLLVQSLTGIASMTGRRDDPPTAAGIPLVDVHGATLLAYSIAVALFHRERTGEGQRIDVNLFNAGLDLQAQELTAFMNTDVPAERSENGIGHPWFPAPYGIYETADDYLTISSGANLEALGDALDLPDLADYDRETLYEDRERIKAEIETALREKTTDEWLSILDRRETWIAPVQSYEELVRDPQVAANEMVQTVDHPDAGEIRLPGIPVSFSKTPGSVRSAAPRLGQSNAAVLEDLGYSAAEIADLAERGIVGSGHAAEDH